MRKDELFSYIDQRRGEILSWGQMFFDCPELGFQEQKTADEITRLLDEWGVPYKKGVAQTGVIATLGEGRGYHIAFAADMDALPRGDGQGCIHACGHSIQTTIALAVMRALLDGKVLDEADGRVSFFFTPAEEFIDFEYRDQLIRDEKIAFRSGKQSMIALGCFDGVDCVISAHANGDKDTLFDIQSTLTGFVSKEAVFLGKSSHSGTAAHLGRNALHAAMLFLQAAQFLKDQYAPEVGLRLQPVITENGGSVNTIPERVVVETYVRANDTETLLDVSTRVDELAESSSAMLGLACEVETTAGYLPLSQSKEINRIVKENMCKFCDEDDIVEGIVSGASGDAGDLSFLLPTVQFGFSGIEGQFHSDCFRVADEENCYIRTSKVVVGTIIDLLFEPGLQVKREGYAQRKSHYLKQLRGGKGF